MTASSSASPSIRCRTCRPWTSITRISTNRPAVTEAAPLDPEDLKIINLARAARAGVAAAEGAAVRDETGRTYAAVAVDLPSLQLTALQLAVAMAASSGAASLEAAAVVSEAVDLDPADLAALRDFGHQITVL